MLYGAHHVEDGIVETWTIADIENLTVPLSEQRRRILLDVGECEGPVAVKTFAKFISSISKGTTSERAIQRLGHAEIYFFDDLGIVNVLEFKVLHIFDVPNKRNVIGCRMEDEICDIHGLKIFQVGKTAQQFERGE